MVRALVTGSTGTVGANIVAELNNRDIEVVGLRRKTSPEDAITDLKMNTVVGDILDPESLAQAMDGIDWVFHVAAVSDYWRTPPEVIYKVNIEGTRNVLQAALNAGVSRLVYTSSSAALGIPTHKGQLLDELATFDLPPSLFPYGHSKHKAEQILKTFVDKGLHAVSVLPSAVMGPRDLKFNSGELIVRAIKNGILPFPKGGLNFVDGNDCALGHIAAAEYGKAGERYILAGHNMTHVETIQIINDELGTRAKILNVPKWCLSPVAEGVDLLHRLGFELPVDKTRVILSGKFIYYDNQRAIDELKLGFRPFSESVRNAYDWYVAHDYLKRRKVRIKE